MVYSCRLIVVAILLFRVCASPANAQTQAGQSSAGGPGEDARLRQVRPFPGDDRFGGRKRVTPDRLGVSVQLRHVAPGIYFIGTGPNPLDLRINIAANANAADTTNADRLWSGGGMGLSLTGTGVNVGVWDEGAILDAHQELTGRATVVDPVASSDHSTHVAGTIAAAGVNPSARGMANQATLRSRDFDDDTSEMSDDAMLIDLSNHSYAHLRGWTTRIDWEIGAVDTWFADRYANSNEDPSFGKYSSYTQSLDEVLYESPELTAVWSASNDRGDAFTNARGDNRYVTFFSANPGFGGWQGPGWYLVVNSGVTSAPPGDGNGGTGYDCLPAGQLAKNTITVGAIDDITADPYTSGDVVMASFSSWGPPDDGRVKPDIVANGIELTSCYATSPDAYAVGSGTSMASPNACGTLALLLEHYRDLNGGSTPASAVLKALAVHTAFDAGNAGPDFAYGWGVLDAAAAADFLNDSESATPTSRHLIRATYSGSADDYPFQVGGGSDLKATLVWTDLAPSSLPSSALDDSTEALVRDLDLSIIGPPSSTTYWPWTLDRLDPSAGAVRTARNSVDNVEQVEIDSALAGCYTVRVSHTGGTFAQSYALLISGASLDVTPPQITCPGDVVASADAGMCYATNVGLGTPTTDDNCGVADVTNDAPAQFPVGVTTVTWTVTDTSGNSAQCTQTVTVTDDELPVITCPVDINQTADAGTCGATIDVGTATATDNCGVDPVVGTRSDGLELTDDYPVGTTTITWVATDLSGNSAQCTQTVTVTDNELPSITCPTDVGVSADAGLCYATNVNLGTPVTDDNCGVADVTNDAPAQFPIGVTTVTWTVTDTSGNSAQCTQTVTVTDDELPSITCPTDVAASADAGMCYATNVGLGTPTTDDNCGVADVTNDAPAQFPIGVTTVTWTVTDTSGNSAQCTQTVTVTDDENPSITCPTDVGVSADAGVCYATSVGLGTPTTGDNCGVSDVTNDAPAQFPVGDTIVTWTVTDTSGNTAQCTQTVTVTEDELPVITCPVDINQTADAGQCGATIDVGTATATDNCGVDPVVGTRSDGLELTDDYPVGTTTITWVATDLSGNSAQCTQTVTVTDDEAPTPGVASSPPYASSSPVEVTYAGASDNCGVAEVQLWFKKDDSAWAYSDWSSTGASGSFYFTPSGEGTYCFDLVAVDTVGNASPPPPPSGDGDTCTVYETCTPPEITQQPAPQTVYVGEPVTFCVTATGGQAPGSPLAMGGTGGPRPGAMGENDKQRQVAERYGKLPLSFVENRGQLDEAVRYVIRGPQASAFFTDTGVTFDLWEAATEDTATRKRAVLRTTLVDSSPETRVVGTDELSGKVNYFIGNDQSKWYRDVPAFKSVTYRDVWPGIDVAYYGDGKQLEYDVCVAPGADLAQVRLRYEGAEGIWLDDSGDLHVETAVTEFVERVPAIYQIRDEEEVCLEGSFVLIDNETVAFRVDEHDPSLPLVIDPESDLIWSTFLGGGERDDALAIAVGPEDCAYVAGYTESSDFPTTLGAFDEDHNGGIDAFVAKLCEDELVYSTFLGGDSTDSASGIAVDEDGCAYVTGGTYGLGFPITPGAYDEVYGGMAHADAFVTKLSADGSVLDYSTFLGGVDPDAGQGITVDPIGCAYVSGYTESSDFPTTLNAYDQDYNPPDPVSGSPRDAFVTKLNESGTDLLYSTYLGQNCEHGADIEIDASRCAYVVGFTDSPSFPTTADAYDTTYNGNPSDAFVSKLCPNLSGQSSLVYSTFLGSSGRDCGGSIDVDSDQCAYVSGYTESSGFPTTPGAFDTTHNGGEDVFVTKLNESGSDLLYSTYVGAGSNENAVSVSVDASRCAYITGYTLSSGFPTTPDPYDPTYNGSYDCFVTKLNPLATDLVYSTFLGGSDLDSGRDIAVSPSGYAYVSGQTFSVDFPIKNAYDTDYDGNQDAFVARLSTPNVIGLWYQWRKDGVSIPGENASCITIDPVACADAADYTCTVTNSCGSVTSDPATLTVNAPPQIDTHPGSQVVCVGGPVTFCVTASAECGTLTYQWYKDGAPIGTDSDCYDIPSCTTDDAGIYVCEVTNSCGSATSDAAGLGVGECRTVAEAKQMSDGYAVAVKGQTITAAFDDFFYVESDDRACGIRVEEPGHGLAEGTRVDVAGSLQTNSDGERYIDASLVVETDSGSIAPLAMNNLAVGGGDWFYDPVTGAGQKGISGATGLNNIGLLITTWGKVLQGAPGDTDPMQIDDGSGLHVEVVLPSGVTSPGYGAYVAVTGASSCATEDQQITGPDNPTYQDFQRRVILATSIDVLQSPPAWNYTGEMVYIAPGDFLMGNSGVGDDATYGNPDWEEPQHSVYLSGYWIGKHHVTREEYRQFIEAGGYSNPAYWPDEGWDWKEANNRTEPDWWAPDQNWGSPPGQFTQTDEHPVVGVTYYEAEAFCKWAGGHLPTEAQFEKAARWDGHPRVYPWGDSWDAERCNCWYDTLYPGYQTAPVCSYSPSGDSPYGCCDMAASVWEWCADWLDYGYYSQTPAYGWLDTQGPVESGESPPYRVIRSASWGDSLGEYRCAYRGRCLPGGDGEGWGQINGFRVAR